MCSNDESHVCINQCCVHVCFDVNARTFSLKLPGNSSVLSPSKKRKRCHSSSGKGLLMSLTCISVYRQRLYSFVPQWVFPLHYPHTPTLLHYTTHTIILHIHTLTLHIHTLTLHYPHHHITHPHPHITHPHPYITLPTPSHYTSTPSHSHYTSTPITLHHPHHHTAPSTPSHYTCIHTLTLHHPMHPHILHCSCPQ